jgi:hypothetical protein
MVGTVAQVGRVGTVDQQGSQVGLGGHPPVVDQQGPTPAQEQ